MNRLVSIIIPVYNGSNYLTEAIDSALAQTYINIEVLVVNDGSNDGGKTEHIAKSYGNKIRYYSKDNGGVSSALNLGIKKAKGEWISWLSHDDVYFPNKVKDQISFSLKNPKAKFIYSAYINSDEQDHGVNRLHTWYSDTTIPQYIQLLWGNKINGCTTLIHKTCFADVGLFNEDNTTAQDYEMWLTMALNYHLYLCPCLVLKRRVHQDMGSLKLSKQQSFDIRKTLERINARISILLSNNNNDKATVIKQHILCGDAYLFRSYRDLAIIRYKQAILIQPNIKYKVLVRIILGSWYFPKKKLISLFWKSIAVKNRVIPR